MELGHKQSGAGSIQANATVESYRAQRGLLQAHDHGTTETSTKCRRTGRHARAALRNPGLPVPGLCPVGAGTLVSRGPRVADLCGASDSTPGTTCDGIAVMKPE